MMRIARPVILSLLLLTALASGCEREQDAATVPVDPPGPIRAVVRTVRGDFTIELRPEAAPVSCASFVNLVQRNFFDDLTFYRHSQVVRQVGNPHGSKDRRWEPGYRLSPEFSPDLKFDRPGMVALVRETDDVRSPVRPNEFFVTTKPQSERFTFVFPVFAEVVEGQEVVDSIRENDRVFGIDIVGDPSSLLQTHRDLVVKWNRRLDASPDPRD